MAVNVRKAKGQKLWLNISTVIQNSKTFGGVSRKDIKAPINQKKEKPNVFDYLNHLH